MMTDLPHHIASDAEIRGLMEAMSQLLSTAISTASGLPTLVTIARSIPIAAAQWRSAATVVVSLPVICPTILCRYLIRSEEDRYTPTDRVEQLQGDVVGVVRRLCASHIQLDYHYLSPGPLYTADSS